MTEERVLIHRVIDREPGAERAFVDRYRGLVLGLARGRFHMDEDDADELLNMTIARLWEHEHRALRAWRGEGRFTSYLTVIVTRLVLHRRRSSSPDRSGADADQIVDPRPSADRALVDSDRRRAAAHALREVSARDRLLLVLRFLDERSPTEIARLTRMRAGTVRKALHDALRRLRTRVRTEHPELFAAEPGERE